MKQYQEMLVKIKEAVPEAELYIQSVLPISINKEKECADNVIIVDFNGELKKLAAEYDVIFINLYDLYVLNGAMDPDLTKDGIHLKPEAYDRWYDAIRGYIYE